MKHYEVLIIGAGTAGLSAQKEVAKTTDNYLVVDSGPLGTTCARVGCMPSKVLIEAAHIFHQRTKFNAIGASACGSKLDSAALMRHVRQLRDRFVNGVKKDMEPWMSTHLRSAQARFVSAGELELDGERITADKIIVATGSEATVPAPWRAAGQALHTTDTFFEMETLPASLAVLGAGAIGLE
ncbi:MAG: dihydrolipoyl dehydrogenase, partial [Proteobacteria bacterium]